MALIYSRYIALTILDRIFHHPLPHHQNFWSNNRIIINWTEYVKFHHYNVCIRNKHFKILTGSLQWDNVFIYLNTILRTVDVLALTLTTFYVWIIELRIFAYSMFIGWRLTWTWWLSIDNEGKDHWLFLNNNDNWRLYLWNHWLIY